MAVPEHNWLVDFLTFDIENDDLVIALIEEKEVLMDFIDEEAIRDFIREWNEEYCEAHDLCPECRSKLEETFIDVEYGDTTVSEIDGLRCPLCGY